MVKGKYIYEYEDSGLVLGIDWEYDSDGSHIAITDKAKNYKPKRRRVTVEEVLRRRLELKRQEDEFLALVQADDLE